HYLDWANMPNPFRHYEGVPVLDLPADPPAPQISALEALESKTGSSLARNGAEFLSQLMFYSASISASKRVPSTGAVYALRVNPSSGNLHPTEFHFCSQGLAGWTDGLYHYRPSSHMAEQRAIGDFDRKFVDDSAPLMFVLTSIAWREAWKYRDRAFRYCLHDVGHAWQALTLAARSIGCESFALGHFSDDSVAEACLLAPDEWPMLIVGLHGPSIPIRKPVETVDVAETLLFGGQPNELSATICRTTPYLIIGSRGFTAPRRSARRSRSPVLVPLLASPAHSLSWKSACRRLRPLPATLGTSFAPGAPPSTSGEETNLFRSRNLPLSSTAQRSLSSRISLRFVSFTCTFTSIASRVWRRAFTATDRSTKGSRKSRKGTSV